MIITIDCRWLDASGVGVYLRECLPFFLESGHSFFLLGSAEKIATVVSEKKNAAILHCRIKPFSIAELLAFPRSLIKKINTSDLYYSPYFNIPGFIKIPVFTTIHDIVFPDMPELSLRPGLAARMWFYRRAFNHSRKIFTVSEFSKFRIEHYSHNKVPVIVTHSAIQPHLLKPGTERNRAGKKKIILYIGNIKKHKGLSILLDAFFLARKQGLDYRLVIAGSRENFRSKDSNLLFTSFPGKEDAVEFTGFLPNEQLIKVLEEASLLVQPSLYEGFCLPPLEALVSGTPALISDIPVLKEIYYENPIKILGRELPVHWFKAGDAIDLKEKIISLLHSKNPEPVKKDPEMENLYTFKKTSRVILETLCKQGNLEE